MVAVFSRPVNYISDLGGRITTAWKHGAMRGSRQASAFLEGASGRVGFPATLASAKCIETKKLPDGKTFTCISCHSENLVDYVPCVNMPESDPVAHGLQCGECARMWCSTIGRRECPSCRNETYSLHCLRLKKRFSLLEGEEWDRECGRLLGFLGVEGAKEVMTNFFGEMTNKSAKEIMKIIDKIGMEKYIESLSGAYDKMAAIEWIKTSQLLANSKFASKLSVMPASAIIELASIIIFVVLIDVYQLINGRTVYLSDLTSFATHKIPYIIVCELAVGACGIGSLAYALIEDGFALTSKILYYIWRGASITLKYVWQKEAENFITPTNIFNQSNDWSIRQEISDWRDSNNNQENSV